MATKRTKFDWSILDRYSLFLILYESYPEIVDQKLTSTEVRNIFNRYIKRSLPVRVSKQADFYVEPGYIYVGGNYYSEYDKRKIQCIEVNFVYNPLDRHVKIDKKKFIRICKTFADVVLHEIIHMRQYRRRKFKVIPDYVSTAEMKELRREQNYLGCSDEIDAYSFNIACELLDKFNNDKKMVIKYVTKEHRRGYCKSSSLRSYLKAFEYDHNHPIIRKLKKKVIKYIPNAEMGKPYRNKDWINT